MVLHINGNLRKRVSKKLGPFKREEWSTQSFDLRLTPDDGKVAPTQDLTFQLVPAPAGHVLQGSVRGSQCMFALVERGSQNKKLPLSMNSVSGVELKGTIHVIESPAKTD